MPARTLDAGLAILYPKGTTQPRHAARSLDEPKLALTRTDAAEVSVPPTLRVSKELPRGAQT